MRRVPHPFRRAVFRGMGVVLPPLLTIVIFLWVGSTIESYVLEPVTSAARSVITFSLSGNVREELPPTARRDTTDKTVFIVDGDRYKRLSNGQYVPLNVYETVKNTAKSNGRAGSMPENGVGYYRQYVDIKYLRPHIVVPVFLLLFVTLMYLLGRFLAAGIGRVFWNLIERLIARLPLVRNVYSSVKQVTDFMLSESEIEYTRVVAVEYPRKGIWSLGLVTGESMLDIRSAANEPVLSILIPSSPMPVTGYTITVLKSEAVDLDLTVDQAFQFCISCGVVVPPHQMQAPFGVAQELPGPNGAPAIGHDGELKTARISQEADPASRTANNDTSLPLDRGKPVNERQSDQG